MLRLRAVRDLLVEEIGGVDPEWGRYGRRKPEVDEERHAGQRDAVQQDEVRRAVQREHLDRAGRKALSMALLSWVAAAVLLLTHPAPTDFLAFRGSDLVFTLGVLLVVAYGGFRLGQWEKLNAIGRALADLEEREGA